MASIPQLVPEKKLETSKRYHKWCQALSNIVAPVLGGILYGIIGFEKLVITSFLLLLSAILERFISNTFLKKRARKP